MIVLDEQISYARIVADVERMYRGAVISSAIKYFSV